MPGAHKIGAAISGPELRAKFYGHHAFSELRDPTSEFGTALSFRSLVFWNSLLNFKQGISFVICAFSLLFPRFRWVRQGTKVLG